jgi:hypothetical protein
MRNTIYPLLLFLFVGAACKSKKATQPALPDMSPAFHAQLLKKDSTLSLDSFYFIRIDTFSKKKTLIHERFPLLHIMSRINEELAQVYQGIDTPRIKPSGNTLEKIDYLNEEKAYVGKQIDSLNQLIPTADSITPVGYRLLYKVTVNKPNQFSVSDTISYSIDRNMRISDWDRNIDRDLDSLSIGHHIRTVDMRK